MALNLSATSISALYLGSTAISAAYLGSTQVYSTGGADPYAVASFSPDLVFDFEQEYYRTGGTETTFDSAMTHSRDGRATMVDSDGLLKWAPHNLALNSATPATQSITVVSGADYTVECTGVSIALSGAGTGTVTEGNPVEITASTTTLTLTVTGSTGTMWAYRSDLGGMVSNPDQPAGFETYVPTTSAARYLPRRGHHIYNGAEWVNEGLLHESEVRTNLLTYSNEFDNGVWASSGVNKAVVSGVSPDGGSSVYRLLPSGPAIHAIYRGGFSSTVQSTFSVYAKANGYTKIRLQNDNTSGLGVLFDLVLGTATPDNANYTVYSIEDAGNGFYRCSITTPTVNGVAAAAVYVTDSSGSSIFVADGTSSILIYGAQLEVGSTPSSYIPTSGSTVTRAADTIPVPSANLPWNPLAVSIQMQGTATGDSYTPTRWYLDANNAILQDIGTTNFTFTQEAAGVVDTVTGGSFTSGVNTPFNFASRHGSTFINGAIDGTALTVNPTPTALPDLSSTDLNLAFDYMGTIKLLRIWADDLGDSGIAEASTNA